MAIPSRFLKPAANRLSQKKSGKKSGKPPEKKPKKIGGKAVSSINPTVIGVLLSVFAHGLFIAFGPRTNFSFAALTEAAQQEDAEETIVPLVEISPADRNRLPGFAQPRRSTGLNSLALPPGLPNTTSRRVPTPQPAAPSGSQTRSRNIPAATPQNQNRRTRLPSNITSTTLSSPGFNVRRTPGNAGASAPTVVVPPTPTNGIPNLDGFTSSQSDIQVATQGGLGTQNGVPAPPGTRPPTTGSETGANPDLLTQQIEGATGNNGNTPNAGADELARSNGADSAAGSDEEQGEPIAIAEPTIDTSPAQKDAPRLLAGFTHDPRETTEEEATVNLEAWLAATAADKNEVVSATSNIEIDSKFKVCKEIPPNEGLIGVLVNPDGSQEGAQVLRSIGYDILNRQALSAVEYTDFGQPEKPTQYEVVIDVTYQPEGCVEDLPEVE